MIQKKICMLGATGVGKTSLVRRFVQSIYSEKYHSTIGVKIDKKSVTVGDDGVNLLLWDLQGEDAEFKIRPSFLRGASGYFIVVDLTRHETFVTAFSIQQMVEREVGPLPFIVLFNKNDLTEQFDILPTELEQMMNYGWKMFRTSAKSGERVEEAFQKLAERMLAADNG
ncbi:MAG: GTP-binding protein [Acidobacteria bacterium]|nr:GTP-binding protein [Acidobacteriota bacterium]MBK8147826.1 GTP-binding protein [Acidobacteriota bacterium]MBK8812109.1 GTP-binding protein [Acidobacteriota bacterium]